MNPTYTQQRQNVGTGRLEVYGLPFGATSGHFHSIGAYPIGSHIPGGRFVVNSPSYVTSKYNQGTRVERTAILPDRTGEHLFHNDRATDFSEDIPAILKDGKFSFIGVSALASDTCKDDCTPVDCCPIGYEGLEQRQNYWPRIKQVMDIITQGFVAVYAESDVDTDDEIFVRVEVTDEDAKPCQMIGGITNIADDGTQEVGSNVRVDMGAKAGEAVLIELGGMNSK